MITVIHQTAPLEATFTAKSTVGSRGSRIQGAPGGGLGANPTKSNFLTRDLNAKFK